MIPRPSLRERRPSLPRSKKKAESREGFWKNVKSFEPTPERLHLVSLAKVEVPHQAGKALSRQEIAGASLIGNEPYSKTSASRVAQSPSSQKADRLTKITARTIPEGPPFRSHRLFRTFNPHVLCDRLIQNPPQSRSYCHLPPRQAGFAPQYCMGCLSLGPPIASRRQAWEQALHNGRLRHNDDGLLAESTPG